MFQRLIIAALIVMGIIMLSRIIRQWLSGNVRRRDDGTEIRGQWEVVNPLGKLGANAVVNIRYSTSSVAQGAAELFAYGTAVRVE